MAATKSTQPILIVQDIQLKRSKYTGEIPTASELSPGEIAVNSHDGKAFTLADTKVVEIGKDADLRKYVKSDTVLVPQASEQIINMVAMTQVKYDAIPKKDDHTLYIIL